MGIWSSKQQTFDLKETLELLDSYNWSNEESKFEKFKELKNHLEENAVSLNEYWSGCIWSQSNDGADWQVLLPLWEVMQSYSYLADILDEETKILLATVVPQKEGLHHLNFVHREFGEIEQIRELKQSYKTEFVRRGLANSDAEREALHLLFKQPEYFFPLFNYNPIINVNIENAAEVLEDSQQFDEVVSQYEEKEKISTWRQKQGLKPLVVNVGAAEDEAAEAAIKQRLNPPKREKNAYATQSDTQKFFGENYIPTTEKLTLAKSAQKGLVDFVRDRLDREEPRPSQNEINAALIFAVKRIKKNPEANRTDSLTMIDMLLEAGGDINCAYQDDPSSEPTTILEWAQKNQPDLVQPLRDRSATMSTTRPASAPQSPKNAKGNEEKKERVLQS